MAIAKATGNLSFKVLPDEMRKRFNGTSSFTGIDANDKWVYDKVKVTYNKDNIHSTSNSHSLSRYYNMPPSPYFTSIRKWLDPIDITSSVWTRG